MTLRKTDFNRMQFNKKLQQFRTEQSINILNAVFNKQRKLLKNVWFIDTLLYNVIIIDVQIISTRRNKAIHIRPHYCFFLWFCDAIQQASDIHNAFGSTVWLVMNSSWRFLLNWTTSQQNRSSGILKVNGVCSSTRTFTYLPLGEARHIS